MLSSGLHGPALQINMQAKHIQAKHHRHKIKLSKSKSKTQRNINSEKKYFVRMN